MARSDTPGTDNVTGIDEIYKQHSDGTRAARAEKAEEARKADDDSSLESVEGTLAEEAKFVGNPDDLRKDVDSEEKFSEELEDGDDDSGLPEPAKAKPAKKTAAKRG